MRSLTTVVFLLVIGGPHAALAQSARVATVEQPIEAATPERPAADGAPDRAAERAATTGRARPDRPPGKAAKPAPKKDPLLPDDWMKALPWRAIGPANMSGRITAIAVYEKDPYQFWVASASGGLLKTVNNGRTFEHQFDREATVSIGDVAVAQSDPNIVWVGTGEGNPRNSVSWGDGVYKSTDGGKTWTNMGLKESFQIGRVVIHPHDPDVVYVGALGRLWGPNEERGLFKTADGGKTWEKILYIDASTGVVDVNLSPADPDALLVATYERARDGFDGNDPVKRWGPGTGIYKSTDGGQSFRVITAGLPSCALGRIDIEYYRKDPNVVYAAIETEKIGKQPDDTPYVGLQGEDADVGARLTEIVKDSPAAKAGLQQGDIVVRVGDDTIQSYAGLTARLRRQVAGDTVKVEVSRARKSVSVDVVLERFPAAKPDEETEDESAGRRRPRSPRSPFAESLGGQLENMQDQQGPDGHEYGGIYRSDDGGESWRRINSLNARPMYFSMLRVDPSDANNVYSAGISLYRSKDGGHEFTDDGHGNEVHVDHHALWIDPQDGRHMLLGNDGGLYVTHDRMATWDHLNQFAIGQFYDVAVSPRRDYMVFGGLQDNGTWGGPARVRNGDGPINEDWVSIGGGDGFVCRVDPRDPDLVYFESQNGGIGRRNLRTGEAGFMRARAPRGTRYRFNWKTPFLLSHHNSGIYYVAGNFVLRSWFQGDDLQAISPEITRTENGSASALAESPKRAGMLYVGTTDGALWRTDDGGGKWLDLFDPQPAATDEEKAADAHGAAGDAITGLWSGTTRSPRFPDATSEFSLDLKLADATKVTGSLDSRMGGGPIADGAFDAAERKLTFTYEDEPMVLEFTGAIDDAGVLTGKLEMAGGRFSMEVTATRGASKAKGAAGGGATLAKLLPQPMWISTIEPSRHDEKRVYIAVDGHRSDDDRPYAFVSDDQGLAWRSLTDNLPDHVGSARALREDLVNPDVLYLGTEFDALVSIDRGDTWTSFRRGNLPTVAVHDFAQHPLTGDLVAATHGRSVWILDVTPLRQLSREVIARNASLLRPNEVVYWQDRPERGGTLRRFGGENPTGNARIHYVVGKPAGRLKLEVRDRSGDVLAELTANNEKGMHVAEWNLRGTGTGNRRARVEPGIYDVVLTVDNEKLTQPLRVLADPERPEAILWGAAFDAQLEVERQLRGADEDQGDDER